MPRRAFRKIILDCQIDLKLKINKIANVPMYTKCCSYFRILAKQILRTFETLPVTASSSRLPLRLTGVFGAQVVGEQKLQGDQTLPCSAPPPSRFQTLLVGVHYLPTSGNWTPGSKINQLINKTISYQFLSQSIVPLDFD